MFTGIVEELGEVVSVTALADDSLRVGIRGPVVTSDAHLGDSIAVNGVCLTVCELDSGAFFADVMRETLVRSSLRDKYTGARVNLERPVTLSARLGGHLVQGHVDGIGTIRSRAASQNWEVVRVGLPDSLARYVVEKGSVCVDGVSLTVSDVGADDQGSWFEVSLIPTTLSMTTLGSRSIGEVVNIEVDVLAKYVERLLHAGERS